MTVTVAGYSGDAGDAMAAPAHPNHQANGMKFSTPDSDNDAYTGGNCAYVCGWWFRLCSTNALTQSPYSIWTAGGVVFDVKESRVLVKG